MSSIIKAFCSDFNWDYPNRAASPGLYAQTDPLELIRWYEDLGVNTIQTFCVSLNGYAWFRGDAVPIQPGLPDNFLQQLTSLAHERDMQVMGYFCLASNPRWEKDNSGLYHAETKEPFRIPFTTQYLDMFCESVRDALIHTDVDGFMIDWFNVPQRELWLDCEKQMYGELMGEAFPSSGIVPPAETLEFDRRVLTRAWRRIKDTVQATRPAIIWTNQPFTKVNDPRWNNHPLLREVDWVLNEDPDMALLEWLASQVGSHTRVIQNLCGWITHDANIWRDIDTSRFDFYGFAQADPATGLPCTDVTYYDRVPVQQRNIEIIREAYHSIKDPELVAAK